MKLIIEISQEDFNEAKILLIEGLSNNIEYAVANGKPYEEITNEDIQTAIKQGYKDGYEMAKAKFERPQGECKDCKNYLSYYEQFTNKPRGDGYCVIAKMTSEGMTYINCTDSWSCADFCPCCGADMKGGAE